MDNERKLKVRPFGDPYRQRTGKEQPKSQVVLSGNWLIQAGFKPGQDVCVKVKSGEITLTVENV